MTPAERNALIESYGAAWPQLKAAVAEFPKDMWKYKPAPNRWSIHEIIIHLADSEANSFIRCRCLIAEPGKTIFAYDQDVWAQRLHYHEQSTDDALELFHWLRQMSYNLLKRLPEDTWKNSVMHPEIGPMAFELWLEIYERHVRGHINQMRGNLDAWKKQA
jgi:hypothetical protein